MRGENWKDLWQQPCPCKRMVRTSTTKVAAMQEIAAQQKEPQNELWLVESHESTRQRVEASLPTKHEDRSAGIGFTMTHYNLVHKFYSYASSNEDSGCKICSGQGMEETRDKSSMATGEKSRVRRRFFWKHKETKRSSTLLH